VVTDRLAIQLLGEFRVSLQALYQDVRAGRAPSRSTLLRVVDEPA
jgi:hypothetical protein